MWDYYNGGVFVCLCLINLSRTGATRAGRARGGGLGRDARFRHGAGLGVRLEVKVTEEHEHVGHDEHLGPRKSGRALVLLEDEDGVGEDDDELEHLRLRDVSLPRASNAERRHQIIRVHHNVNERIAGGTKVNIDAVVRRHEMADEPPRPDEEGVMVNVQKAELLCLFAQNHKHSVQELQILVVVVQPHPEKNVERPFVAPRHLSAPDRKFQLGHLDDKHAEDDDVKQRLVRVVRQHEPFRVKRFPARHYLGPDETKQQVPTRRRRWKLGRQRADPRLGVHIGDGFTFTV